VRLTHASGKRGAKKVALVGKGITFDTGGISIKPAASMHHMTSDMRRGRRHRGRRDGRPAEPARGRHRDGADGREHAELDGSGPATC
jgi:hypothetical protein